jgi:small conductance mechanosensitive channel
VTDPQIEIDQLRVLLRPLTIEELKVVADTWHDHLRQKVGEVAEAQITVQNLQDGESNETLKTQLVDLRTQEMRITARTQLVLEQLKSKGGDVKQREQYVAAVSRISREADSTSYWTAIRVEISNWLRHEDGGIFYIQRLMAAVTILILFWIASRVAGRACAKMLARHQKASQLLAKFANRTIGGVVVVFGLLVALAILGVPVGPMMAALGGGGFIIGFAMQETLGNFASGLLIMVYRPFGLNDYVNIAGAEGTVQEMSLVATTLLTPDNKVLVIPNKKAWGQTIMNFTGRKTRRVDLTFKISYADNIQQAMEVLMSAAQGHELVLGEPGVQVHVGQLADSSVDLQCRPWVRTPDYQTVHQELTHLIKDRFDAEQIGFPSPRRVVNGTSETSNTP